MRDIRLHIQNHCCLISVLLESVDLPLLEFLPWLPRPAVVLAMVLI